MDQDINTGISMQVLAALEKIQKKMHLDTAQHISVVDEAFTARLTKARERSFDYILRKDAGLLVSKIDKSQPTHAENIALKMQLSASANKLGVGEQQKVASQVQESLSVYVNGLPLDFTEEEIGILFGQQGKIKRIKLYHTADGKAKGDALITFHRPEVAAATCIKFNGLDIGDGCAISVVRADFKASGAGSSKVALSVDTANYTSTIACSSNSDGSNDWYAATTSSSNTTNYPRSAVLKHRAFDGDRPAISFDSLLALCFLLPEESAVQKHPVVLIDGAFDSGRTLHDDEYTANIETDMLIECCSHGTIKYILMITVDYISSRLQEEEFSDRICRHERCEANALYDTKLFKDICNLAGCVAVSFELDAESSACCSALSGISINNRQLTTVEMNSSTYAALLDRFARRQGTVASTDSSVPTAVVEENNPPHQKLPVIPPPPPPPPPHCIPRAIREMMPTISAATSTHNGYVGESVVENKTETETTAAAILYATAADEMDDFLNSLL